MSTAAPSRGRPLASRVMRPPGPPGRLSTVRCIALWSVAVGLFWVSVPTLVGFYEVTLPVAFALASLQCGTLPLATRFPRSAMLMHIACLVVIGTLTRDDVYEEFWPVPIASLFALMVILIVLGGRETWFISVSAWWLSFLAMALVVLLDREPFATADEWGDDLLISFTVTLVALVMSMFIGQRRRVREIVAVARRDVELEQARRATVEERARIARELHDVVAHSMSIVHIQAESAKYRIHDLEGARTEFDDIARSARSALGEMRRLLEALHPVEGETFYAPQPGVVDIPALVRGAEKMGSDVTFESELKSDALSPLLELTVYRIVQEALSNVIKHAPRARVGLTLSLTEDDVVVCVANDPPPAGTAARMAAPSGGRGLRGMRERVALSDGTVQQGRRLDGGFEVTARLPVIRTDI